MISQTNKYVGLKIQPAHLAKTAIILIQFLLIIFIAFKIDKMTAGDLTSSLFFYNYDFGFSKRAFLGALLSNYFPLNTFAFDSLITAFRYMHILCGTLFVCLFYKAVPTKNNANNYIYFAFSLIYIASPFFIKQIVFLNLKVDFIGIMAIIFLIINTENTPSKLTLVIKHAFVQTVIIGLILIHEAQLLLSVPFIIMSHALYLIIKLKLSYYKVMLHLIPIMFTIVCLTLALITNAEPNISQVELFNYHMGKITTPEIYFGANVMDPGHIRIEPLYSHIHDNLEITKKFFLSRAETFIFLTPQYFIIFTPFLLFFFHLLKNITCKELIILSLLWC